MTSALALRRASVQLGARVRVQTCLALVVVLAALAASAQAAPARTSLPTIERQVMCVVCKIPLNIAQSPQADRERAYIQSLIDQGQTQDQIKRALVAQYGLSVLAVPSSRGFGLFAYLVPLAAAALGGAVVVLLLMRWRRRARELPAPPASLSAAERERLDADLTRFGH